MKRYEFTLRYALSTPARPSDEMVEALGEAGCDDALVGVGRAGRIALEFSRVAPDARGAILSAIADVRQALPSAQLIEVSPDLLGLTDIATFVGCSRQNTRKLLLRSDGAGPAPAHEGTTALWHLAPVLIWLAREKGYGTDPELLAVAEAAMKVNAALAAAAADVDTQQELQALLA